MDKGQSHVFLIQEYLHCKQLELDQVGGPTVEFGKEEVDHTEIFEKSGVTPDGAHRTGASVHTTTDLTYSLVRIVTASLLTLPHP